MHKTDLSHFDTMPVSSKVWVFQSNRKFTNDEIIEIDAIVNAFTINWTSHGNDLDAKAKVIDALFIVIMVNENKAEASGCSIDKSFHMLKEIETKYNVNLFDRLKIAYIDQNDEIHVTNKSMLKEMIKSNSVSENSLFYNNIIQNKFDLLNKWKIPIKESWLVNT